MQTSHSAFLGLNPISGPCNCTVLCFSYANFLSIRMFLSSVQCKRKNTIITIICVTINRQLKCVIVTALLAGCIQ